MSCRPIRWLWGLIPLALIGLMVNYFARPSIEADLKQRGELALKEAGLPWAGIRFDGRDGILSGIAFDDGAREKAMAIVAARNGVRIVDDRASLVDKVDDFYWMAMRESGRIRIKGFVPDNDTRKTIIGMASASFPGLEIDDRMKTARGAPPEDAWLSGVNFAFKQLGHLKNGRTRLDTTDFTIVGEPHDIQAYNQIDQALKTGLPRGISLKSRNILSPKVSPFSWAASIRAKQLVLNGYVPDIESRKKLIADAGKKFPDLQIIDQLTIASGAPKNWLKGSTVALAALQRLGSGQATMSDANLRVIGATRKNTLNADIQDFLNSSLPQEFGNKVEIALIKTTAVKLNWHAVLKETSLVLEGDVPDRTTQKSLIDRARLDFPNRRVINRMNVKSVAPPEGWSTTAMRALDAMTRLSEGEATLSGKILRLSGRGQDGSSSETVRETVNSYLPEGYQGYEFVNPPAPTYSRYNYTETEEDGDVWWRSFLARAKKKAAKPIIDVKKILASKTPVAADLCGSALNKVATTGIVRFRTNSSYIKNTSYPTLDTIVGIAQKCLSAAFEISGHTDSDGSSSYNQDLSLARAKSIITYLNNKGVAATRMTSAGYGETRPIAPNDSNANKARNRRIEFKVLTK